MGSGQLERRIVEAGKQFNPARPQNKPAIAMIPPAPYAKLASWTSGATLGAIPYENTSLNHLYCSPNKLWEYPNAGVPILATRLPEMEKMIEQYGTGILLNQNFSAQDILDSLEAISQEDFQIMRLNCAKFCETENWQKYKTRLRDVYRRIAS